jgi:hypothetical protein
MPPHVQWDVRIGQGHTLYITRPCSSSMAGMSQQLQTHSDMLAGLQLCVLHTPGTQAASTPWHVVPSHGHAVHVLVRACHSLTYLAVLWGRWVYNQYAAAPAHRSGQGSTCIAACHSAVSAC